MFQFHQLLPVIFAEEVVLKNLSIVFVVSGFVNTLQTRRFINADGARPHSFFVVPSAGSGTSAFELIFHAVAFALTDDGFRVVQ